MRSENGKRYSETTSHLMAKETTKEKIIKELKRIEEDSLYSSKGHFYAAQSWEKWHYKLGIPATIFSALAGVSAIAEQNVLAGVIAFCVATVAGLITFLNPNEKASVHRNAGNEYNDLKNKSRILYEIEANSLDEKVLTEKMKELDKARSELNKKSPQIPKGSFEQARRGIEEGEASYKADV